MGLIPKHYYTFLLPPQIFLKSLMQFLKINRHIPLFIYASLSSGLISRARSNIIIASTGFPKFVNASPDINSDILPLYKYTFEKFGFILRT